MTQKSGCVVNETAVSGVAKNLRGCREIGPDRIMIWLRGQADSAIGATQIDVTKFFRPEIVFRHVGEASKRPQSPYDLHGPTGFLQHFAVQRGNNVLAGVDPTTWQLKFRIWLRLMR